MQPFLLLPVAGMFAREMILFWIKNAIMVVYTVNLSGSGQEL